MNIRKSRKSYTKMGVQNVVEVAAMVVGNLVQLIAKKI